MQWDELDRKIDYWDRSLDRPQLQQLGFDNAAN